jgi:hypothetical protein
MLLAVSNFSKKLFLDVFKYDGTNVSFFSAKLKKKSSKIGFEICFARLAIIDNSSFKHVKYFLKCIDFMLICSVCKQTEKLAN